MSRARIAGWSAVFVAATLGAGRAEGSELRTYVFGGTIGAIADEDGLIGQQFRVGDPFEVTLAVDPEVRKVSGNGDIYSHYGRGSLTMTIGDATFDGPPLSDLQFSVRDSDFYGDEFNAYQDRRPDDPRVSGHQIQVVLMDRSGDAFPSTDLPDAIDLLDFGNRDAVLRIFPTNWDDMSPSYASGDVEYARVTTTDGTIESTVPEPGSIAVLGVGAVAFLWGRRRAGAKAGLRPRAGGR